ncbi:YfcE family phosphodiesterase [Tersicoccus phoenicis]|uniref:Phosphoesterase n=1 Tax=Tersicoccus phoenicis TaxID=554083 RepID=A0A1R1LB76_9MICC|nr:metallophosphoesterase family protein [Tersicoccus phoenicis]OMH24779.1 YfcE family phosphodiesterase [Tersicoccus phoenicis]
MSSGALRVLVLSDTHAPRFWKGVPAGLRDPLAAADVILHAGDVCTTAVLDELAAHAPIHVVRGNNDGDDVAAWDGADGGDSRGVPETVELDLGGLTVAMIHDAGPRQGRDRRMRRRFPDAGLVVFGHSHIPLDDADGAVHLFNPGSPTDKRRQPVATYGELIIAGGCLLRHAIVPLPPRGH